MPRFYKILILTIALVLLWVRMAPAMVWYIEAHSRGYKYCILEGYSYQLEVEASVWSLRITSIYPKCIRN